MLPHSVIDGIHGTLQTIVTLSVARVKKRLLHTAVRLYCKKNDPCSLIGRIGLPLMANSLQQRRVHFVCIGSRHVKREGLLNGTHVIIKT